MSQSRRDLERQYEEVFAGCIVMTSVDYFVIFDFNIGSGVRERGKLSMFCVRAWRSVIHLQGILINFPMSCTNLRVKTASSAKR